MNSQGKKTPLILQEAPKTELEILYRDEFYIAVHKPANLLVHPYKKESNEKRCLMKDLRDQIGQYLYPIHRLDRPVSGIVIFGLRPDPIKKLQDIWHSDSVSKFYTGLARGSFEGPGSFEFALNNDKKVPQDAKTLYRPRALYQSATLLDIQILTGRRHQIRRHFARRVQHLLGDRTYGKKKYNDYYRDNFGLERVFLHGREFRFIHPYTEEEIVIKCPLAPDLQEVINKMKNELVKSYE